jgi:hypothetical protein
MEAGTTVLRDIHGLDAIPWLPLAPGWWYVSGLVGLLLLLIATRYWLIYKTGWLGWRGDAYRQLRVLKKALPGEDPHVVAGRLSELLRRIAMVRSGRREAAGLTGDTWLRWLVEHDKTGFDWEQHGQLLLTAPYMPSAMPIERKDLAILIRAATRWIDASRPPRQKKNLYRRFKDLPQQFKGLLAGVLGRAGATRA